MWCGLLLVSVLLLVRGGVAQAPGDEDDECPQQPSRAPAMLKILLDSQRYQDLLGSSQAVWTELDGDGDGLSWSQSSEQCRRSVSGCLESGPQDNWLFTQHVSTSLSLEQQRSLRVYLDVSWSINVCTPDPDCFIEVYSFVVSEPQDAAVFTDTARYSLWNTLGRRSNSLVSSRLRLTLQQDQRGLYIAFRDPGTCVVINSVRVHYFQCPELMPNALTTYPVTIAPISGNTTASPRCVENARASGTLVCSAAGFWLEDALCRCEPGFEEGPQGCVVAAPTPPLFGRPSYVFSVAENVSISFVLGNFSITDDDAFTVRVPPTVNETFAFLDNTDILVVIGSLDFENVALYQFEVVAMDTLGFSSSAAVTVVVVDVNDNAPVFFSFPSTVPIRADTPPGDVLLQVLASDADSSDVISYSLSAISSKEIAIAINALTGEVVFLGGTLASLATYSFLVTVSDGERSSTEMVQISVVVARFVQQELRVREGEEALLVVEVTAPASSVELPFVFSTQNGTATAPDDYSETFRTFIPESSGLGLPASASISVAIGDDLLVEAEERFLVTVHGFLGAIGVSQLLAAAEVVIVSSNDCPLSKGPGTAVSLVTREPLLFRCIDVCCIHTTPGRCPLTYTPGERTLTSSEPLLFQCMHVCSQHLRMGPLCPNY